MPAPEAAARIVVRGLLAVFTAAILVLFQSAFWTTAVTPMMRGMLLAIALSAYFRPSFVLLLLAAFLPLSGALLHPISPDIRTGEALVLAFLAGALARGWTLHRFRDFPFDRLHTVAIVFGLIVAASCVEQLWFIQIQRDFPDVFLRELFTFVNRHYLSSFRGLGTIFHAMLLVEGIALLLYAAHFGRKEHTFVYKLGAALIVGAIAAAALNLRFFTQELIETGQPRQRFVEFLMDERWSAHIGDANAAGAFFSMALFAVAALAFIDRQRARYALPVASILGLAMWLTGSRTAVTIAALMAAACALVVARTLRLTPRRIAAAIVILAIGGAAAANGMSRVLANPEAVDAVRIRSVFLGVTARMLKSDPLFGLGVGQYTTWSRTFMPPELKNVYYARENAHNNFAQIAGELGLAGLAGFGLVLASALAIQGETRRRSPRIVWPALVGLIAFVATWVGNHPLLVPIVAYPFWLGLGIAAALTAAQPLRYGATIVAASALLLAASMPSRIDRKVTLIDLTRVTYGMDGARTMAERMRFFVAGGATRIVLPLRARSVPEHPLAVDITIDKAHAATVSLTNDRWTEWTLEVPNSSSTRAHQVDLRLRDPAETHGAAPQGYRLDVGEWQIIPRPHG